MSRVFKFHNDVDTDQIIASQYLLLPNIEEMKYMPLSLSIRIFQRRCRKATSLWPGRILAAVPPENRRRVC